MDSGNVQYVSITGTSNMCNVTKCASAPACKIIDGQFPCCQRFGCSKLVLKTVEKPFFGPQLFSRPYLNWSIQVRVRTYVFTDSENVQSSPAMDTGYIALDALMYVYMCACMNSENFFRVYLIFMYTPIRSSAIYIYMYICIYKEKSR
jgi:hypothetical protein